MAESMGQLSPSFEPIDIRDPRVAKTLWYLGLWPAGERLAHIVADKWWPIRVPEWSEQGTGCSSGSNLPLVDAPWTVIYTTVFDPIGGAEGIVHEAGHLTLHALGVAFESHDGELIKNVPDELFVSPIRKDKLRPMSAVLHAHYSYVLVTALDLIIADGMDEGGGLAHLVYNLPRIEEGVVTINEHAKWTEAGEAFWSGLRNWTERTIEDAHERLERDNA